MTERIAGLRDEAGGLVALIAMDRLVGARARGRTPWGIARAAK